MEQLQSDIETLQQAIGALSVKLEAAGTLLGAYNGMITCDDCSARGFHIVGKVGEGLKAEVCKTCGGMGHHQVSWWAFDKNKN